MSYFFFRVYAKPHREWRPLGPHYVLLGCVIPDQEWITSFGGGNDDGSWPTRAPEHLVVHREPRAHTHTHARTHTHTHTHTHKRTHTYTHAYKHKLTHTETDTHTYTHKTHTHSHIHTRTHTHKGNFICLDAKDFAGIMQRYPKVSVRGAGG